jgi:hypothetical protein
MPTIDYKGDGGPDGTVVGQTATHLLAFYGATPIVQPGATDQAAVSSAAITAPSATLISSSTTQFGFTTSTQANDLVTAVRSLVSRVNSLTVYEATARSALVSLGLIKGSN